MSVAGVDVLIPVYNGAAFVRSSIESIQRQSLSDIRILVVDDGSTDGTPEILAELAAKDSRIHVITKANGGIVDALNTGLAHCSGEFVARHDADDLAYASRLQEQVDYLRAHRACVAVAGAARHIDEKGAFLGTVTELPSPESANPTQIPAREPYLLHPFLMVRREALDRVGGYRHVIHAEDADLYWRLQELGVLSNDPAIQGEYRMHSDSISGQSIRNGRVMAVSSQLSALSTIRRRSGRPDLSFTREEGTKLTNAAGSLQQACQIAARGLMPEEARHLRLAAGAKLLAMAGYRPYEVELSDCAFLKQAFIESEATLDASARKIVLRSFSGAAARLASAGKLKEASTLMCSGMLGPFSIRLLARVLLPASVHGKAKRMINPLRAFVHGR